MAARDLWKCTERRIYPAGSARGETVELSTSYTISLKTDPVACTHAMILCVFPPLSASLVPRFALGMHPFPFLIGTSTRLGQHVGNQST